MNNKTVNTSRSLPRLAALLFLLAAASSLLMAEPRTVFGAGPSEPFDQETELIRVGERLTYAVYLEGFGNIGFADLQVVSRRRIDGRDAFEIRFKVKTFDVVNAAFFPVDEVRTAYIDAASGLPFEGKRVFDPNGFPRETPEEIQAAPSALDLISLIYKVRRAGGEGKFRLRSGWFSYWVQSSQIKSIRIQTEAGVFQACEARLSSRYMLSLGISGLKVYLSEDDTRVPVLATFKTSIGMMTARLTGYIPGGPSEASTDAAVSPVPAATPTPAPTPMPVRPRATPTPAPVKPAYVNNKALGGDLPFSLGERLVYRIKNGDSQIGKVVVEARERGLVEGNDSLVLLATVGESVTGAGIFAKDDYMKSNVNPDSILPFSGESRFRGALDVLNFTAKFDQANGLATSAGSAPAAMPSNTHSLLSLLFAIRSFNLRPSKSAGNPVNDTRVSVWWNGQASIFTVRPLELQTLNLNGQKIAAQQISIITGVPQFDALNIRLWISNDVTRMPVKISAGAYSAELLTDESRSRFR